MSGGEVRVMLVDDSAVIRGLIARMIEGEPGVRIVASVGNGKMAVERLAKEPADVIILDIEMPVMDGLTAIPLLLEVKPDVKIIMASTLTEKNADISLQALQAGAAEYVPKPSSTRELSGGDNFKRELIDKIRNLGLVGRAPRLVSAPAAAKKEAAAPPQKSLYSKPVTLRQTRTGGSAPKVIAIGSSTGGPQALFQVLKDVRPEVNLPVMITQHMPATFTKMLAEHINRATGWPTQEAKDGDRLLPGHAYVAPGDYHMTVANDAGGPTLHLNQEPPENFCRPAVDPMFRSIVKAFGGNVIAVILTGMGQDGLKGAKVIVEAGGTLVAQDEETSVVWGMPGAVATAGICQAVLPLNQLGPHIVGRLKAGAA